MIQKLTKESETFLRLLDEIEENEGILTPELEVQWDSVIAQMAETSDELANTLDYIDAAIEVARIKKDRYVVKQKQLENYKSRVRDTAVSMLSIRSSMKRGSEFSDGAACPWTAATSVTSPGRPNPPFARFSSGGPPAASPANTSSTAFSSSAR